MNCKKGWYTHDGLRNNGIAYFVGEHPQLQSEARYVTPAFYEQHKGIESTKDGAGKTENYNLTITFLSLKK